MVGWFTPEYLEARLKEHEQQRRLSELEARVLETPARLTIAEQLRQVARSVLKEKK